MSLRSAERRMKEGLRRAEMAITVLIVDDNPRLAGFITRNYLPRHPHWMILPASSGEEARRLTDHIMPSIAFINLNIPDCNALHLLRELKKKTPRMTAFILSARVSEEVLSLIVKLGGHESIIKPYDVAAIVAAIEEIERFAELINKNPGKQGPKNTGHMQGSRNREISLPDRKA